MTGVSVLEVPRTRDSRRACVPLPGSAFGVQCGAGAWLSLCPAPLCLPSVGHPLAHEGPVLLSCVSASFCPSPSSPGGSAACVPGSVLWFPGSVGAMPGGPASLSSQPGQAASPAWRYREPY